MPGDDSEVSSATDEPNAPRASYRRETVQDRRAPIAAAAASLVVQAARILLGLGPCFTV
jgi:hypothetical protein